MPQAYDRTNPHPARRPYSLGEAAKDGMLVVMRCNLCHRTVHFLAADLVTILDPKRPAHWPPFQCGKCRSGDYLNARVRLPNRGDYGSLKVGRPAGVKQVQTWTTMLLGQALK